MADSLARVETELEVFQTKVSEAEDEVKALKKSEPDADKEQEKWARWHEKMVAAREDLKQLRTKEKQLRTKEEQLRAEKLLLLQQAAASAAPGEPSPKKQKLATTQELWGSLFDLAHPSVAGLFEQKEQGAGDQQVVVEIGKTKPFGQRVPRKRVFLRPCYAAFFDILWKRFSEVTDEAPTITVTGTPGIGKSLFGLLFLIELIRFLQKEKSSTDHLAMLGALELNGRIVYEHVQSINSTATYYLIDTSEKSIEMTHDFPHAWLQNKNTFLLKDGPCNAYDVRCPTLWTSSPRAGSFQKSDELGDGTFVLPPWTDDELVDCWKADCAPEDLFILGKDSEVLAKTAMNDVLGVFEEGELTESERCEAVLRRWSADLGPVARRVFRPAKAYITLTAALENDLGKEDLEALAGIATSSDSAGVSAKFKISHRLLLMVPSEDYSTYNFIPSSVKIGRRILGKSLKKDLKAAQTLMGTMSGAHLGLVFEPYAHFILAHGSTFSLRKLDDNTTEELKLPPLTTTEVTNADLEELKLEDNKYYTPTDPTFAVIDSWTKNDMYQMTVGRQHAIKSTSKQFKALKDKGPTRIIFVVPKAIEETFETQPLVLTNGKPAKKENGPQGGWNDVQQYVLGL